MERVLIPTRFWAYLEPSLRLFRSGSGATDVGSEVSCHEGDWIMSFRMLTLIISLVVALVFVASAHAKKKDKTDTDGPLTSYAKKEKKRSRVFARASADCSSSRVQTGWLFIQASIPGGGTRTNPRLTHNFSGRVYKRVKASRSGAFIRLYCCQQHNVGAGSGQYQLL